MSKDASDVVNLEHPLRFIEAFPHGPIWCEANVSKSQPLLRDAFVQSK